MIRWALPLLLLLAGCNGCASIPSQDELRASALRIELANGVCSGTAIGTRTILTAKHCTKAFPLVSVNGKPVTVARLIPGDGDRVMIELATDTFTHTASVGPAPKQGDRVRFWGNPRGASMWFRVGYVVAVEGDNVVIDAYGCPGDSGAGLISDAGKLVGVLTHLTVRSDNTECRFTVAITPLA